MSDGCRLAARIWLPADAETAPVPAILEYIPYRKRDFTRPRDEPMHHYFAGYGYAAVRVDLRGSGDSDGLLLDEYLKQEHDDALEVIRWIAQQPWCSGAVGMMGKSWGGFNSLQVAARRPPELKAIITVCSTDDRYLDDVHYMGGCLLNENLTWGSVLMSYNAYPPDPEIVGERWRTMWRDRLEHAVFFPEVWLSIPTGMTTGSTARCARTTAPSPAQSMPSVAGLMLTAMRFLGCWPGSKSRAKVSSAHGHISIRTTGFRVQRSDFCRRRCAGGTNG